MSEQFSQLNPNSLAYRFVQTSIEEESLVLDMKRVKQRTLLYMEILQTIRQSDNLTEIFEVITAKLLSSFHAVYVSIYKLDQSQNRKEGIAVKGSIISEAKITYCETCSNIQIANILNEKHHFGEGQIGKIFERYTAGVTDCELNLTEIFAGKAYLLVPIVLPEIDRDRPLWGFLTVHQCEGSGDQITWDQDDVLMLQQIVMQIEILLQREQRDRLAMTQLEDANRSYEVLYRWTQQYRSLVEQIPSVSYISPIENTPESVYISPQIKDLLGVTASEWDAGFFNIWEHYVHSDDRDRVEQEIFHTIKTGDPFRCEYRMVTSTGKIIWVQDNACLGLATDGKTQVLRGSAFDISDRKESELRFKGIFNNTFQFTGLLSTDGILLEANQTALEFGGLTREQVINKPAWEAYWFSISEDTQNRFKESIKLAAQGEFIRYEMDIFGAGETIVTIDFSLRPLKDESGQVVLLIPEGRDISGLKATEKALKRSEARLAEAQRVAKFGNWEWDILADKIIWSDGLFDIFERDPDLGTPLYDEHLLYFEVEDRETLNQAVQRAIKTGASYRLELRLIQPDQSYRYVEAIGHAEYDRNGQAVRLYGTAQDISDRKLAEKKILQSKALLRLTIDNAPVGIATFNLETKFLIVNQSFCQIFGYDAEELLNMSAIELTHPDSLEKTAAALQILLNHEANNVQIEKHYMHKDGHIIDAISRISLMRDDQGNPLQFIANVEDVTERKRTEAKLAEAKIAEAANQAKSEFLAVMSHELRTPMNAVIGMTGLLLDTPLSPTQQQYVSTIHQGGEVLLSIINNILDFSRIESGYLEIEQYPFKLQQCVDEVLDLMTSRLAEKSLEIFALIDLDIPSQIIGDYNRLRQILVNLVSNAIKFTDQGEIVINVTSRLMNQKANSYELLFKVRDTGIGIDQAAIAKLFQAFRQADSSINRKYGGTGLGLAICKQLCEAMGGQISVESTIGEGSIFSFSIQVTAIAPEPIAIAPELQSTRVLNISTNQTYQQAIGSYTQPWGMNIQPAHSATDALQLLTESSFDLVLIDRYLDENDGLELAQNIQDIFPDLRLILLTSVREIVQPKFINHASNVITKPITASKLYQALTNKSIHQNPAVASDLHISPVQTLDKDFAQQYPFKILIVEDNPINQQILSLILEKIGYTSMVVGDGLEAINILAHQSFDVIFMDIQMPTMDGLSATKQIRQNFNYHPWIIGLSANAFMESRDLAISAGMDDYLTKPLQVEELVAALASVNLSLSSKAKSPIKLEIQSSLKHFSLNLVMIDNLEKMIGTQGLNNLICDYLEHSLQTIANMQEAFQNGDIEVIANESHTLKGGSGAFGATYLCAFCKELQSLCHKILNNSYSFEECMEEIKNLLDSIAQEYDHVSQAFQSRIGETKI